MFRDYLPHGERGNCWDSATIDPGDVSGEVDLRGAPHISIIVDANKTATIDYEASPDGSHWTYCSNISAELPQGGGSTTAHVFETVGSRYARLKRDSGDSGTVTITATIQSK